MHLFKFAAAIFGCLFVGGMGWIGTACLGHLYQDHVLVDQIRTNIAAQQQQQRPQQPAEPK